MEIPLVPPETYVISFISLDLMALLSCVTVLEPGTGPRPKLDNFQYIFFIYSTIFSTFLFDCSLKLIDEVLTPTTIVYSLETLNYLFDRQSKVIHCLYPHIDKRELSCPHYSQNKIE